MDRDPMYLKHAVLFRPQLSFPSASEIHVFGDSFIFCNRNLSIIFVWQEGYDFFQIKQKNRWVPGLASEEKRQCVLLTSQSLWKKLPFCSCARANHAYNSAQYGMRNAILGNHLNSLYLPILVYGSEVWSIYDKDDYNLTITMYLVRAQK